MLAEVNSKTFGDGGWGGGKEPLSNIAVQHGEIRNPFLYTEAKKNLKEVPWTRNGKRAAATEKRTCQCLKQDQQQPKNRTRKAGLPEETPRNSTNLGAWGEGTRMQPQSPTTITKISETSSLVWCTFFSFLLLYLKLYSAQIASFFSSHLFPRQNRGCVIYSISRIYIYVYIYSIFIMQ